MHRPERIPATDEPRSWNLEPTTFLGKVYKDNQLPRVHQEHVAAMQVAVRNLCGMHFLGAIPTLQEQLNRGTVAGDDVINSGTLQTLEHQGNRVVLPLNGIQNPVIRDAKAL
jgi:hypothetical protein